MYMLRPVVPDQDYPSLAELISVTGLHPVTAADMHDELRQQAPGTVRRQMVADGPGGRPAGYSLVLRFPWWERTHVWVAVAPACRRQGLGAALLADVLAFARDLGAPWLGSEVVAEDEASVAFARSHGFEQGRHLITSALRLADFDPAPFAGVVEALQAEGIRFFTMADEGDTPEAQAKLWALNRSASLDIPGRERSFSTLEAYRQRVCGAAWYRPDLQLLAADGEQWVGLASLEPREDGILWNRMTGVVREYRGRRIALALKLLAVQVALRHRFTELQTNNDAENLPMLAVNRKMGYRQTGGVYLMQARQ
jgi:GNAT superfamily N-acetyltransferase